jgi:hypothetical protein
MPFDRRPEVPFWVPGTVPIDSTEASSLFKAFDDDLSHSLDREEMELILEALGMSELDRTAAIQMMFEVTDEVDQEAFRLWLKRHDFIERHVGFGEKIFLTLSEASISRAGGYCAWVVVMFIFISVITYMLESLPSLKSYPSDCIDSKYCEPVITGTTKAIFLNTERVVIFVFTVDYLLRLVTAHTTRHFNFKEPDILGFYLSMQVVYDNDSLMRNKAKVQHALNAGAIRKTLKFVFSPLNLVDLFSILPFFLEELLTGGDGLLVLRILRLCRLFRLFKLKKYSAGFDVFLHTLVQSSEAITVLLFILALLLVFLGSLVFLAEGGAWYRPDDDCNGVQCDAHDPPFPDGAYLRLTREGGLEQTPFRSIFDSCWFIMTTITTVGYGDMYPQSDFGRFVSMVCMVLGILAMAMPITVLGSNFQTQFDEQKKREYVNNRDIFKSLEIGLLAQKANIDPEDTVATEISECEYRKICSAESELRHKFGIELGAEAGIREDLTRLEKNMKGLEEKIDTVLNAMSENPSLIKGNALVSSSPLTPARSLAAIATVSAGALSRAGSDKSKAMQLAVQEAMEPVSPLLASSAQGETGNNGEAWMDADDMGSKVLL